MMVEPMTVLAVAKAATAAHKTLKEADAQVAALARERGVSKDVLWAEIQAETLRQAGETVGRVTDPPGWRAAAEAFAQADRDRAPATTASRCGCGAGARVRCDMIGRSRPTSLRGRPRVVRSSAEAERRE